MTKHEDRITLSLGNWVALLALAIVPLGALITGWSDIKADAAVTRTKIEQLSKDVIELKASIATKDRQ